MLYVALIVYLATAVASAFLCASETAVLMLTPGRVHRLAEAERHGSPALERLSDQRHRLRATTTLMGGAAFATAAAFGWMLGEVFWASDFGAGTDVVSGTLGAASTIAGAALVVLLSYALIQALPRTLAVANPERLGLSTAGYALAMTRLLYPLARALGAPWKWGVSVAGGHPDVSPWAVTPEWRGTDSDEQAEREGAEEALLEAVSDFADKVVREVMVPRTDTKALPDTATASDAVALIAKTGFTRIPVYHSTIDDVRGVLYAKDLLKAIVDDGVDQTVVDLARQPYFVPETKPAQELLVEMRSQTHIAIVADEYGGTAGLVTLEDLLEEIVGDISDEYDREEPLVVEVGAEHYKVSARLPIDDLNDLLGMDFDIEADSVGGLFTEVAGRIPEVGESVDIEGVRFTVTELQGTRICQLSVRPAGSSSEGA